MNIKEFKKKFKKYSRIFKNKNFLFTIFVYPAIYFAYIYALRYLNRNPFGDKFVLWYSGLTFFGLLILTLFAGYELIEKRLTHKVQGDKLRMKQGQKNWNR